ncbi:MAG: hypothetical protein AB7H77_11765 [Bdellovibrionales bacterium]
MAVADGRPAPVAYIVRAIAPSLIEKTMRLHDEAHKLAVRLNGGESGILAHDDAPGYVLERKTAAVSGTIPLWGQTGDFFVAVDTMRVRIEMEGIFGIGSGYAFWPGFSAHAVDIDRPFLSETGYRSFLGIHAAPQPGLTPDLFAREVIASYVKRELKSRLVSIAEKYRD